MAASSYFPEFYHAFNPREGCWSRYRITDSRGEIATLTFSITSKQGEGMWLELFTEQEGHEAVAGFWVKGDPTDDGNVLMVRVQNAGEPALEIDKATLEKLKNQGQNAFGAKSATPIGPTFGKFENLPEETLKVGGKKIKCRHTKLVGADGKFSEIWMHDEVAPFGVVKLVSGTEEVVLLDFGEGAKTKMKGPFTPVVIE